MTAPDRPFEEALRTARALAAETLRDRIAPHYGPIAEAMAYATEGGKGLRAFLVMESARLHGIAPEDAAPAAAGIECLHAYSLVHDDLPCMDDDDLRRGQPTVHRKWDEATAVLTGDALQSLAFGLVAEARGPAEGRLALVTSLAQAAGVAGMVGGQALDIAAERAETPLDLDAITRLQAGKTGALISWSAMAGPRLAGDSPAALGAYAGNLGLAFQIADDILDVEGCADRTGKAVGKDAAAGKATFVSLLGLEGAKSRAAELVTRACDALAPYGRGGESLKAAARFVISRDS